MDIRKPYYLLLVDIQRSTLLDPADREKVFGALETEIRRLNETVDPRPVRKLQISYGDEIAGLFDSPGGLYDIADSLRHALYGVTDIRFVACRGQVGVDAEDLREAGGEVFKRANQLMSGSGGLKKARRFCRWEIGPDLQNRALTALTEISHRMLNHMTAYQYHVFRLVRSGLSQAEAAVHLGRHRQSVSEAVKRGGAQEVLEAEDSIRALLLNGNPWQGELNGC